MTRRTPRPPRLAETLLWLAIPNAEWRDAVIGDLREDYAARVAARPIGARLTYIADAVRLSCGFFWRRLASRDSGAEHTLSLSVTGSDLAVPRRRPIMADFFRDFQYACRTLASRPGFALAAAFTLALGIGANAAVFNLVDQLLIRPLTIPQVDRMVMLAQTTPRDEFTDESISPANFLDLRKETSVFESISAYEWKGVNLSGADEPEYIHSFSLSAGALESVGARPAVGRFFLPDEEQIGSHQRVVLSHRLWQRRFAGNPAIVGQTIRIDGAPSVVVGVAGEGFDFPMGAELWTPLAFTDKTAALRRDGYLTVIGRLAEGRTLADAQAQMQIVGKRLEQEYPDDNASTSIEVRTLEHGMRDEGLPTILVLWQVAVTLILLIGCVNVANLLMARSAGRRREFAMRLALGASTGRLARQLLTEGVVLSLLAGVLSIAVSWAGVYALRVSMPAQLLRFLPGWDRLGIDVSLLVYTFAVSCVAAVVFSLLPALHAARVDLDEALKENGRTNGGAQRDRGRSLLVIAEVAIALALLVAAGLCVGGGLRLLRGDHGYDPNNLLTMRLMLPDQKYPDPAARARFFDAFLERIADLPGVESAAAASTLPSYSSNNGRTILVEGAPVVNMNERPTVDYRPSSPSLLATLRIPLFKGRGIEATDRDDTPRVAVISQGAAERFWPGADPVGRRFQLADGPWVTVVGVCGDVMHNWFRREIRPTVYVPLRQDPRPAMSVAIRTHGEPTAITSAVRSAAAAIDPDQPIFDVSSMRALRAVRMIGVSYVSGVMSVLGALAFVLAALGVYSVMAYSVSQRTHELGVRIALGASATDVLGLTVGQALKLTGIGIGVGAVLAALAAQAMSRSLFGIVSMELWPFGAFAGVLIVTALVASYVPARRALRIDPAIALRGE